MDFVQPIRDPEEVDLPYHELHKLLDGTIISVFRTK
jgi:hypothetical protein